MLQAKLIELGVDCIHVFLRGSEQAVDDVELELLVFGLDQTGDPRVGEEPGPSAKIAVALKRGQVTIGWEKQGAAHLEL